MTGLNNSVPVWHSPNFGNVAVDPRMYTAGRLGAECAESQTGESSLVSEVTTGGLFMGGMVGVPKVVNYGNTISAIKDANSLVTSDIIKNLKPAEKADIYSKIFNANYVGSKITKKLSDPKLVTAYEKSLSAYKEAIIKGDTVKAAFHKANLDTIAKQGIKPGVLANIKKALGGTVTQETAENVLKNGAKSAKNAAKTAKVVKTSAEAATTAAKATNQASKLWQATKTTMKTAGAGFMFAIEAAIEGFTEVIPAFTQGGVGEGVKQTAKSTVSVGASVGGFVGGAKGGAAAGAAIGTAICPGIGSAIGGAIGGIVGGLAGSWLGRKAVKAVTGKSYSEKQAEKAQAEAQAKVEEQAKAEAQMAQILQQQMLYPQFGAPQFNVPNPYADYQMAQIPQQQMLYPQFGAPQFNMPKPYADYQIPNSYNIYA